VPRLIDKLDAAVGRTPALLDDVDYLRCGPSPSALIAPNGRYAAGWYERWDGALNLDATNAFDMAFQRWFHFTLDAGRYFLIFHIADLHRAANTSISIADKETGQFDHVSLTRLPPAADVVVDEPHRRFEDPSTGSVLWISDDDAELRFSIHADHLHLVGVGRRALGDPFVQVTRYQRGRGALQWYGNWALVHGVMVRGDDITPLPTGSLGTYDRTLGHQRGLQSWNWIALAGEARCAQSGAITTIALQVQEDRDDARPRVASRKHVLWVGDRLHKLPDARFDYAALDGDVGATTPWRVASARRGPRWLDLLFTPGFRRRDEKSLVVLKADFRQYYGRVDGSVHVDGSTWNLEGVFAVGEESSLEL